MLSRSLARLPARWGLAIAARRGANATRATSTTFSSHPTTRLQWQAHAVPTQLPARTLESFRSFSQPAALQEENGSEVKPKDDNQKTNPRRHKAKKEFETFNFPPYEEILAAAKVRVAEEINRKKARKKILRAARGTPEHQSLARPQISPFGPFEDVIQPIALALWGGKAEERQNTPKLTYTAHFLGATCLWRLAIRVTKPETENEIWRRLWRDTRPKHDGAQIEGKSEENDVPPLEAVVQDVFKRRVAKLALEKPGLQRASEARTRQKAPEAPEHDDGPPINYQFSNPHVDRLPFKARNHMRHFDVTGPLPDRFADQSSVVPYIWTQTVGNVLANTFQLEKIALTRLTSGISIWIWRGDFEMREMEAFMSCERRRRLEILKKLEKDANNEARQRKTLPIMGAKSLKAEKQRQEQLDRKGRILREEGGWSKILDFLQEMTRCKGVKMNSAGKPDTKKPTLWLPKKTKTKEIPFTDQMPHPESAFIEDIWSRNMVRNQDPKALQNYAAFLRSRMEAGYVPAQTDPAAQREGETVRGWRNRKAKKAHLIDRRNRANKEEGWREGDRVATAELSSGNDDGQGDKSGPWSIHRARPRPSDAVKHDRASLESILDEDEHESKSRGRNQRRRRTARRPKGKGKSKTKKTSVTQKKEREKATRKGV
ncbi:hypothetical protein IWZ03DRAFT_47392 [Phyllosticta citriasiana]|uniref:Uncharacterized protein n=1 Tax=Phyllosticta citriasiana TaxID=595635 RepID=A0ABR1KEG9_9PEZI